MKEVWQEITQGIPNKIVFGTVLFTLLLLALLAFCFVTYVSLEDAKIPQKDPKDNAFHAISTSKPTNKTNFTL